MILHQTWFHPVWYTKYTKYSQLVQNLRYCRSCISIPTYKKCYAGTIFEFPENNHASQKSFLPCLDLLSYLLSDFGIFSRQRKFHVTPVFEKNECPKPRASSHREKNLLIEKTTSHGTMVQACCGLYCRLSTVCLSVHPGQKIVKYHNKLSGAWLVDESAVGWKGGYVCGDGN